MTQDGAQPIQAIDRRGSDRDQVAVPLRVLFPEQAVLGITRDASPSGVMVTTDAVLRVEVELEEEGRIVRRPGRLVRVQRLDSAQIAVAIEFDRP